MERVAILIAVFNALSFGFREAYSQSIDWKGEVSAWLTTRQAGEQRSQVGLRYIPTVSLATGVGSGLTLDFEASAQGTVARAVQWNRDPQSRALARMYRAWARLSSAQVELRAGLQRLSFGSASLLRPLMWFDRIDPRDPTQNTEGVWGLLGRYYFLNNANIWIWGLYGNTGRVGLESVPSSRSRPQFGGRIQFPVSTGELGITFHHRSADWSNVSPGGESVSSDRIAEDKYALDGKWDMGLGIWFEACYQRRGIPIRALRSQTLATVGSDYTLELGSGLHVLGEYLYGALGERALGPGKVTSIAASAFNYPMSMIDNLTLMIYRDLRGRSWYRFFLWQRLYDDWMVNFMVFWNPGTFALYDSQGEAAAFTGKGLQLMVVFNY